MIAFAAMTVGLMSVGQMEPLPHLGSLTEQLRAPARLAVAPDDSVFVSDPLNRHIARFDASGRLAGTWPVPEGPIGVAVHPDGRLFVSLRDAPKVAVYDSTFNFVEYLGEDEPLASFAGPTDIDIAADTGRIYVVDAEGDRIYGFESDGSLALILGSRGSWPGQFIYPSAITVDEPRNRIIVADHDKSRLQVFTRAGVFLHQFGDRLKSTGGVPEGWMPRPLGLTADAHGNVYVSDALMGTVRVFGLTGMDFGKVVEYGHEPGKLRTPSDLAVSNDGSRLYVASINSSRVEVYACGTDFAVGQTTYRRSGFARRSNSASGRARPTCWKVCPTGGTSATNGLWGLAGGPSDAEGPCGADLRQLRETSWDGPHIVEDRPDICGTCHGITGQPGIHAGSVEGQAVLCMSCHNAAGRALNVAIYERDVADPFGTNTTAADGRGRSHAWGVPAVNPSADAQLPRGAMSSYLDRDGNVKCSTCHNQHNTNYGPSYLRVSNDRDAMCKECHAPLDRGVGDGGSHPVGFPYPGGEDEYPPGGELAPLIIKDGMLECSTCHAAHGADSGGANGGDGDGMLLRSVNDETLCRICHTQHTIHEASGEWQPTCKECHGTHDADDENVNVALIAREIYETPVTFVEPDLACTGQKDFIHGVCDPPSYDGVCEVCHTSTDHHRNSPELNHAHYPDTPCTECHLHSTGFLTSCTDCHGAPPEGSVSPNRAGSHAVHLTGVNGPNVPDCNTCHAPFGSVAHDNGAVSFASGLDASGDGDIDLAEADVCNTCHSEGGPFDGVNDPLIGAKANWMDGVYDGDRLKPGKEDWCAGCHDSEGAVVHDIQAPSVAGDNETWGANVAGHGLYQVVCTECHDPRLSHTDGVAKTFSERFPLCPGGLPKPPDERELDREAYNSGYRLRRVNGDRALEVPRDSHDYTYTSDDSRLCLCCHDEIKLLGVPANYQTYVPRPPAYLRLPEGVAQTNYRNEYEWGHGWPLVDGKPSNIHWDHMGNGAQLWDVDHDGVTLDSCFTCVTCHNPHGARKPNGEPTAVMTMADLAISFDVYNDGTTDREYGYIGSGAFFEPGGDLHCTTCHPVSGPGPDPPHAGYEHTRFYRQWLDLQGEASLECRDDGGCGAKVTGEVRNRIRKER